MYILILMVIIIALAFVFLKQLDQRRWQRYQIDRDLFFRQNPYAFQSSHDHLIHVAMNKSAQFKLVNELMLKSSEQTIVKNAVIQRMPAQAHHQFIIKVMVEEISVGYLEKQYAERFCQSLLETDFFIGRPISIRAEIRFCELKPNVHGCRVKLDLPSDPTLANELIFEKPKA